MFEVESQKETKNVEPKIKKVRTETVLMKWYSDNLKPFSVTSLARGSLLRSILTVRDQVPLLCHMWLPKGFLSQQCNFVAHCLKFRII